MGRVRLDRMRRVLNADDPCPQAGCTLRASRHTHYHAGPGVPVEVVRYNSPRWREICRNEGWRP